MIIESLQYLQWDSDFFGRRVGILRPTSRLSGADVRLLLTGDHDYRLIYVFTGEAEPACADAGLMPVDVKVTFRKTPEAGCVPGKQTCRPYAGGATEALLALAYASGVYSRYRVDAILAPYFERLYGLWLERSLSGEIADIVYVQSENGAINGFVTAGGGDGIVQIGLMAVDGRCRGNGIGTALLTAVASYASTSHAHEIRVAAQLANERACHFYQKNGYREYQRSYIYHIHR